MKRVQQGFTLIELMIVVAIIGILAAIAIPSYQNYVNKSKFTEVIMATAPYKTAIDACYQNYQLFTACTPGSGGVPPDTTAGTGYVASVTVNATTDAITVVSQNILISGVAGQTYILDPTAGIAGSSSAGSLTWVVDATSTCKAAAIC